MKRSLLAIAAIATLATGTAYAQGTVTIYGRLNASVESQKVVDIDPISGDFVVDTRSALQNNASRIGFKGTEDLGGGLSAGFLLEAGFDVGNGQAQSRFFGRESNVYLEGSWGKLRLGNMGATAAYYATADYISMHNHDTGTSADAFYLYPGDPTNTIAYTTPSFGGLVLEAQYGLKEGGSKNTIVLAGNYDSGPLHLGFGYVDGSTSIAGVALDDTKEIGIRGLYELGAVTLGAYFIRNTGDAPGVDLERDAWRLSAMYAFGSNELHANFGWAGKIKFNGSNLDGSDATQLTLGYNYNLSKRTKVYALYTTLNGDAANDYGYIAGAKRAVGVGVRHNF